MKNQGHGVTPRPRELDDTHHNHCELGPIKGFDLEDFEEHAAMNMGPPDNNSLMYLTTL